MRRLGFYNVFDGLTSMRAEIIVAAAVIVLAQLTVFSVLVFKCWKFKKETVKENFLGMKTAAVVTVILVILDIIYVLLSLLDIPDLIDEIKAAELSTATFISWVFPVLVLIYGIYAWRCYLRAKKVNLHMMFSGLPSKKKKNRFEEDEADLFGDSKMIDPNAKRTEEDKESRDVMGNRRYIQGEDVDLREFKPLSSGELVPCPYCESLNAYKSKVCVFCGAKLPYTEDKEVKPVSAEDVDVVDGKDNGGK